MKVNLYINYYHDNDRARQLELIRCLQANLDVESIDKIIFIATPVDIENLKLAVSSKIKDLVFYTRLSRPSFHDYFEYSKLYPDCINIISNSDIIFTEESIEQIKERKHVMGKTCLALTRWDLDNVIMDYQNARLFDRPDSQDTWVSYGEFPSVPQASFTIGMAGCDNKIALLLSHYRTVENPSRTIKTYHLHNAPVRNYITNGKHISRLSSPYLLLPPTE